MNYITQKVFSPIGRYLLLIKKVFSRPEKVSDLRERIFTEMENLGIRSMGIVSVISIAMGGVICIQTGINFTSSLLPPYAIGVAVRDSLILEFCPTIVSLILAGKIGSNIASDIGSMRITEQIDALEVMGINSAEYIILPKVAASIVFSPILVVISMFLGVLGGYILGTMTGMVSETKFIYGITYQFNSYYVTYSIIKTVFFAFIMSSVSSFHGYYAGGGSVGVGRSSTKAVVYSSVIILISNFVLTQLLLA